MTIETAEKDVRHPEGKILLKNGNLLDCFPKADQQESIVADNLALDSTGDFLRVSKRTKRDTIKKNHAELPAWAQLFLQHAFFLYAHRNSILNDSRMFLAPLPFQNNLAYTGTSGLRNATLGVYLEWWKDCQRSVITKDGEIRALTYFIAGSPLSGSNRCSAITREGKLEQICFENPFSEIWSSFMRINGRYTEAKQRYQAYTIEETIVKLNELQNNTI